jgi:hypothetical protein
MPRISGPFAWPLARDLARKRDLLARAGGRFVGVTFTKKDGTTRRMQVQPAALALRLKGARASEAARRPPGPGRSGIPTSSPSGTSAPGRRARSTWQRCRASPWTAASTASLPKGG